MGNNTLLILISFFILLSNSCKDSVIDKKTIKVSIETIEEEDSEKLLDDLITQIDSLDAHNVELENSTHAKQDCIFDQSTQTDEFLKGIKELENYQWDSETKTAKIVLNDHWSLTIKRGGCDYFEMSATFFHERILDIEKDKKQIFDSIIWITSLLEDFDGKDIKRVIDEGKVTITKRDEFNYHANFMDEELYELYYFNFSNKNVTTFNIGYYYN